MVQQSQQHNNSHLQSNEAATAASHQSQPRATYATRGMQAAQGSNMLSQQELKALQSMGKNREIYQMLGKTKTNNNLDNYLAGGGSLVARR